MKRYPEYRFDPERHIKEEIERKYGHPATMQEGGVGPETGGHWVYMFELSDPSKTKVFAWLKDRENAPSFPKVLMVSQGATVACAADALRFYAGGTS